MSDEASAQIARLTRELEIVTARYWKLNHAISFAIHKLEAGRIWGGMEWHFNPLHPVHYKPALYRLQSSIRHGEGE